MNEHRNKTATDTHWNERARTLADSKRVNIDDLAQRTLENQFIFAHLGRDDRLLEVGCGNGFLTDDLRQRVDFVDAFDFSENMIASAKSGTGENNNRFLVHSVLTREGLGNDYDTIVCVRVLINLADTQEQCQAIENMASWLKPGGKLILVEGYSDGFAKLTDLREQCDLPALKPASINYYSALDEIRPVVDKHFDIAATWHSGMYDILTRVLYPLLEGADQATGPADFHSKILSLPAALNPDELEPFARLRGFALVKK